MATPGSSTTMNPTTSLNNLPDINNAPPASHTGRNLARRLGAHDELQI
jgi:hypothetical protein